MTKTEVVGFTHSDRISYLERLAKDAQSNRGAFLQLSRIAAGRNDLPKARELFAAVEEQKLRRRNVQK